MKVVRQDGLKDCGVCCLLSIIRYYDGNMSLEVLRELTNTTKNGVSAYNLVETAIKLGFNSYGLKSEVADINKEILPVISHVLVNKSYQHFIVIYDIFEEKKELLVMDPALGKRKLSFSEFNLMSSKYYIYMKPIKKILNLEKKRFINDLVKEFLKENIKYVPYISILTFVYFFLNIIMAFSFKLLLNKAINYSIIQNVFVLLKFFLTIVCLKEIALYLKNLTLLKWSQLLDEELTRSILKRIMLLPYLYYQNRTVGEIISRIKDLEIIKNFLIKLFSTFILDFILVLIFMYILLSINQNIGFIVLILSVFLLVMELLLNKPIFVNTNKYLKNCDKINSLLFESINSISTIKELHIEKEKLNYFYREYQIFLDKTYKLNNLFLISSFLNNLLKEIFTIGVLVMGAILIIENKFSVGNLIVFQSLLGYYLSAYQGVLSLYKEYHKYKISKARIEDLFMIKQENFNCLEYFNKYNLVGNIEIHNLTYSFGYYKIFNGLSLSIKNKDKVFFTGESGAGKSTLMRIISGFIDISYGNITINKMDLTHYHLNTIRNKITYISQNESLFTGSIKDNILFDGKERDNLDKVCEIVKVDEILDKDLGYLKMVEEQGANFSGGEKQRIILARSIMKDSDIYIFDEALNQIDIEKEQEILKGLLNYLKDKTVIVISHRLTCIDLFNRVLTLKNGKIYEEV